jgi:hypothetical protein
MKNHLQKCLILLEKTHPIFPTFPHMGLKFRELAIKVKEKALENKGVLNVWKKWLRMLVITIRHNSPPKPQKWQSSP